MLKSDIQHFPQPSGFTSINIPLLSFENSCPLPMDAPTSAKLDFSLQTSSACETDFYPFFQLNLGIWVYFISMIQALFIPPIPIAAADVGLCGSNPQKRSSIEISSRC
jgi:hypothetical protein